MKNNEATIDIKRDAHGRLVSVSAMMPVWENENDDNSVTVRLPFLGLKFFAFDGLNPDQLIHDAMKGFFASCEKFGLGLDTELIGMGWEKQNDSSLTFTIDNFIFEEIIDTGDKQPQFVDFEHEAILA